jgi:hypothetical protein
MNNRYRMILAGVFIAAMILAAGCLSGSQTESGSQRLAESTGKSDVALAPGYPGAPVPTIPLTQGTGDSALPDEQKLIKRASISLEVTDTRATLDQLRQIASAQGGYVGDLNMNRGSSGRYTGSATLRVAPANLEPTLASIGSLGKVISQNVQVEDVTEEYVDLNARRGALTEERASYERIMQKADKVEDILKTQEQISRVQGEINRIDGRLKYLSNRVDYATISVQVREPEPVGSTSPWSFSEVINDGISAFLAVIGGIVIGLFIFLPFIIIGGVIYLVYRRYFRKNPQKPKEP